MTSAFIIEVNSKLQPDSNEETAALLRVLIYKVDNTTFGDNVPSIPQWTGPPHMIVQVQAILFASLATSLFSAFLAMLGKQWVNRYASVDVRGSAIERSQSRQQKQNGVVNWYFDTVMESLPLMLQAALLLLGFALSRYLWEINMTVALVVLGFTSTGVLFLLFIVVAGAASVSCPFQTPGAQILRQVPGTLQQILDGFHHIPGFIRYIVDIYIQIPDILTPTTLHYILDIIRHILDTIHHIQHIPGMLHPVFSASIQGSLCYPVLIETWYVLKGLPDSLCVASFGLLLILLLPIWLIVDICKAVTWLLVNLFHWLEQGSEQQMALLDLHCILWTLQTSLDTPVRLSTLNYLATTTLDNFDPALVTSCFDILFGCVKVVDSKAVITQDMGQLAAAASMCCLQTLSHLMATSPTSRAVEDTRRQYTRTFPFKTSFNGLPFSHILYIIHRICHPRRAKWFEPLQLWVPWEDYKPSSNEHIAVAHTLNNIAQFKSQSTGGRAPCWMLRFALHSLSQSPLHPTSVVIDSLSIVAIDLGCSPLNTTALDERYVCISQISALSNQGSVHIWMRFLV